MGILKGASRAMAEQKECEKGSIWAPRQASGEALLGQDQFSTSFTDF